MPRTTRLRRSRAFGNSSRIRTTTSHRFGPAPTSIFWTAQTDADILEAFRGIRSTVSSSLRTPASTHARPVLRLADRKLALDEAEKYAREGKAAVEKMLVDEEQAASQRAAIHDALGWVLLQRGKKSEAAKELRNAWELNHKNPQIAYHIGKLYESQKKVAKAEEMYRKGMLPCACPGEPQHRRAASRSRCRHSR